MPYYYTLLTLLMRCHMFAFTYFGGWAASVVWDNISRCLTYLLEQFPNIDAKVQPQSFYPVTGTLAQRGFHFAQQSPCEPGSSIGRPLHDYLCVMT